MLVSAEKVDKLDSSTIAVDCSEADICLLKRHFTKSFTGRQRCNKGQKGFEAWHARVRRFDQRNRSNKNSAYAALISNKSAKDRAKDVEQFDDILRTLINDTNKSENKFGTIRNEEKMLAVKKLMPKSLLNYRFRRTTMSCSERLIALENISNDKVATVPTVRSRKADHQCSNGDRSGCET